MKERLKILFDADISLAAYHLPLDAHPEVGNNALICAMLGLERSEPLAEHKGRSIGFVGRSAEGIPFAELRRRCAEAFGQEPFVWEAGPDTVHSVGVVSGGAQGDFHEAIAHGLDAFLTGETAEHVMADARENGVHFIAGGHYATETFGIRRLGELVAERFGVEHASWTSRTRSSSDVRNVRRSACFRLRSRYPPRQAHIGRGGVVHGDPPDAHGARPGGRDAPP